MRGLVTILLVLFGVAAAYAGVERQANVVCHAPGAELSQGEQMPSGNADVPLYASALSSSSPRLSGAETMPVRVRVGYAGIAWLRACIQSHYAPSFHFCDYSEGKPMAAPRPADRYVYALRKIII